MPAKSSIFAAATLLFAQPAAAATFNFTQLFESGATFTGTFTAADVNIDGRIIYRRSNPGELTAFSGVYSGDGYITPTTFDLNSVDYFSWDGDALIGDGQNELVSLNLFNYSYTVGPVNQPLFCAATTCGHVIDRVNIDPSTDPVHVSASAVPEPAGWALMLMGFTLIGCVVRRRKTHIGLADASL